MNPLETYWMNAIYIYIYIYICIYKNFISSITDSKQIIIIILNKTSLNIIKHDSNFNIKTEKLKMQKEYKQLSM